MVKESQGSDRVHEREGRSVVIVDVGAHKGEFALQVSKLNPDLFTIAIEPNPQLASQLRDKCKDYSIVNMRVLEAAVSLEDGFAELWLGGNPAEASLNRFAQGSNKNAKAVHVATSRLDSVLPSGEDVAFLKIDAQGSDLDVLKSLGDRFQDVRQGMLEVSTCESGGAYETEANLREVLNFLNASGSNVYRISPNDTSSTYVNVFWARPGFDWHSSEIELGLNRIELYAVGKYWHVPSAYEISGFGSWLLAVARRLLGKPNL